MSARQVLGILVLFSGFVVLSLSSFFPTPSRAYANDPTLDAAIYQATVRAGQTAVADKQTRDAREQEAANQRGTAAAIENTRRQAEVDATRSAYATRQVVDTTSTRQALNVQQTATRQALNAQQTRERQSADATVTQGSLQADSTRVANDATATTNAVRAWQTRTADDATSTMEGIYADATRVAVQRQQDAEARDASIRSLAIGLGALVSIALLIIGGGIGLQALWKATLPRPVEVVADRSTMNSSTKDVTPDAPPEYLDVPQPFGHSVEENPVTLTQIAYNPDPNVNARSTQIALDLIARQIEQGQTTDVSSTDGAASTAIIDGHATIE